jgi:hypothetical protein
MIGVAIPETLSEEQIKQLGEVFKCVAVAMVGPIRPSGIYQGRIPPPEDGEK